jgi:hypothetical protein
MRSLHHLAEKASELELLAPATKSGENEKVSQILTRIREQDATLGAAIDRALSQFGAQIVGNQVFDANQTGIFHAITRMIQDFLGITVPILGTVRASRRIRESVNLRKPMMLGPRDDDSRAFEQMAEALLAEDVAIDDLLAGEDIGLDDAPYEIKTSPAIAAGVDGVTEDPFERTPITAPDARPVASPQVVAGPATASSADAPLDSTGAAGRGAVPALIDPYMRRSPRFEVDWMGSLHGPEGIRPVRIFEVSEGGAVVQTPEELRIGDELTLVFEQIPMQPQVPVKVSRRATLGFVVEGEIPAAVMNVAAPPATAVRRMAG